MPKPKNCRKLNARPSIGAVLISEKLLCAVCKCSVEYPALQNILPLPGEKMVP